MPNEIILGLIAAISSIAGSLIGCWTSSKLTNYRIEQLEKKVDSLLTTEKRLALLEHQVSQLERRKDG